MQRSRSIIIATLAIPLALTLAVRPGVAGEPEPAKAEAKAEAKADAKTEAKADAKAEAKADAGAKVELAPITDAEALEDDVFLVLTLPLAADAARSSGVDAAEVADAIAAVVEVGASTAEATPVLVAEADRAKKGGAKPNFGAWVRSQVAEGKRGKELADAIKKKKAEYAAPTDEDKAAIATKIAELKVAMAERRKALHDKRTELVGKGKKVKVADATLKDLKKRLAKDTARKERIEKELADDPSKKDKLEKLLAKAEDKADKAEDKAADKADKAADKADKAEDKGKKAADAKTDGDDTKAAPAKDKGKDKDKGKSDEKKGG